MEDPRPWLSQGDVFRSVPIVRAGVSHGVTAQHLERGPALLVTHACSLDKKTAAGRSKLEYLNFLPIHSVQSLDPQRAQLLRDRAEELTPYEAMYLGDVREVGESYVSLMEPYTLPAAMFGPELQEFPAEETGEAESESRVVAAVNDTRVGCLTEAKLTLFWRKWYVHWTRLLPDA